MLVPNLVHRHVGHLNSMEGNIYQDGAVETSASLAGRGDESRHVDNLTVLQGHEPPLVPRVPATATVPMREHRDDVWQTAAIDGRSAAREERRGRQSAER